MDVPDVVLAAIADRMNRLTEVRWDRCVFQNGNGVSYGWIARDDGRSDFVVLTFAWGDTKGLDGEPITWFGAGATTSSATHSASISERLTGSTTTHTDCERVEDVFGTLVDSKVTAAA